MGLDMYFEKRITTYGKDFPNRTIEVYEGGYFRKFNALHSFIIDRFAKGIDDCRPVYLYQEDLQNTLEVLEAVMADPTSAEDLLPTTSGFFFGSLGYNEWYFDDVEVAIEVMKDLLGFLAGADSDPMNVSRDVIYQASW